MDKGGENGKRALTRKSGIVFGPGGPEMIKHDERQAGRHGREVDWRRELKGGVPGGLFDLKLSSEGKREGCSGENVIKQ